MKIFIYSDLPLEKGKYIWKVAGFNKENLFLINKGAKIFSVVGTPDLWSFEGAVGWIKKENNYAIFIQECDTFNKDTLGIFLSKSDYTSAPEDNRIHEVSSRGLDGMINARFGVYKTGAKIFARDTTIYTLSDTGWIRFVATGIGSFN